MEPATRVFCKLRVLLLIDGTLDRFGAWVTNLSETGFFAETPARAPIGSGIRFSLYLSDDQPPLPGHGSVVWLNDGSDGAEEGLGLKFDPLPPIERQRLLQFLAAQFDAAPAQPVGLTNPAFRQQVEAEAVSALIAELSAPPVPEKQVVEPSTPSEPEYENPSETHLSDTSLPPDVEAPTEESLPQNDVFEAVPTAEQPNEDLPAPSEPELPVWPFRPGELPTGLKDLIVIHSASHETSVSQLEVDGDGKLVQHHSTSMKNLFVNAYWRALGLEGRAIALNAILPDELLPAAVAPVENKEEWMTTAEEWAMLIYESCANPSGILLLAGSPAFGELFESLSNAFSSAELPVPAMTPTGVSIAQGLDKLAQTNTPILVLEACGEDYWATQIYQDGSLNCWSIPAESQGTPQDVLREAILYCGRLPRTLIAPESLASLLPKDIPIESVPYASDECLELTQIGALRLALGAASE